MKKLGLKEVSAIFGGDSCSTKNEFQNYTFVNPGENQFHTTQICVPTTTCKDKHGKRTSVTYSRSQQMPADHCR